MPPKTIDADEMIVAFESHDHGMRHFLDSETGEILTLIEDYPDEEGERQLEREPDRFIYIEPLPSSEGYQIMEDFVDTVPDPEVGAELALALEEVRPFRRFKDVLLRYSEVREQWFRFYDQQMMDIIQHWLVSNGIEAVLEHRVLGKR